MRVLSRELLSPSSNVEVLQQTEILPKLPLVLTIFSEITSIPKDDSALLRCLISVLAPCTMLLVAGRSLSRVTTGIFSTPRDILVEHLYQFSIGGLEAIVRDYENRDAP